MCINNNKNNDHRAFVTFLVNENEYPVQGLNAANNLSICIKNILDYISRLICPEH